MVECTMNKRERKTERGKKCPNLFCRACISWFKDIEKKLSVAVSMNHGKLVGTNYMYFCMKFNKYEQYLHNFKVIFQLICWIEIYMEFVTVTALFPNELVSRHFLLICRNIKHF